MRNFSPSDDELIANQLKRRIFVKLEQIDHEQLRIDVTQWTINDNFSDRQTARVVTDWNEFNGNGNPIYPAQPTEREREIAMQIDCAWHVNDRSRSFTNVQVKRPAYAPVCNGRDRVEACAEQRTNWVSCKASGKSNTRDQPHDILASKFDSSMCWLLSLLLKIAFKPMKKKWKTFRSNVKFKSLCAQQTDFSIFAVVAVVVVRVCYSCWLSVCMRVCVSHLFAFVTASLRPDGNAIKPLINDKDRTVAHKCSHRKQLDKQKCPNNERSPIVDCSIDRVTADFERRCRRVFFLSRLCHLREVWNEQWIRLQRKCREFISIRFERYAVIGRISISFINQFTMHNKMTGWE